MSPACRLPSGPELGTGGGPLPGPRTGPGPPGRPSWPRARPAQELPLLGKGPASSCWWSSGRRQWLFTAPGPGAMRCWGLGEAEERRGCGVHLSSRERGGEVKPVCGRTPAQPLLLCAGGRSLHSVNGFRPLGMAQLSDERPWFSHPQKGNGAPAYLSCLQPQG